MNWLDRLIQADRKNHARPRTNKLGVVCKAEMRRVDRVTELDDAVRAFVYAIEPRLAAEIKRVELRRSMLIVYATSSSSSFTLTRLLTPRITQLRESARKPIGSVRVWLAR